MIVLGCDSAQDSDDRGYALAQSGVVLWTGAKPYAVPAIATPEVIAGERPWAGVGKRKRLTGKGLITFCVNNGFQLRDAWTWGGAARPLFVQLEVRDWKNLVLPGCAGMPGDVFCRNLAQRLKLPPETDHNQIDAAGIAVAASLLPLVKLKKLVPKGFR